MGRNIFIFWVHFLHSQVSETYSCNSTCQLVHVTVVLLLQKSNASGKDSSTLEKIEKEEKEEIKMKMTQSGDGVICGY
jgi:hypothetical protein